MARCLADQLSEIQNLLLQPTAENISHVTRCLESLAEDVARMRSALIRGEGDPEASRQFLSAVREQTLRAGELLNNAARFYSALNAQADTAGYERHGFICTIEAPRRALARL